jgi:hypothetical protein
MRPIINSQTGLINMTNPEVPIRTHRTRDIGTDKVPYSIDCKRTSVADPDPNPDPDPHVFGPPGSGSTSLRYGSGSCSGSGSESFYHHAKVVRKTLIPTIFLLFFTFYL